MKLASTISKIASKWLAILSFLIDDNPIYKAAEHLFAGASAGYGVVIAYWQYIEPTLLGKLWPQKDKLDQDSILIKTFITFGYLN